MAYEVVMLYHFHMPSCFLGTFSEYPYLSMEKILFDLIPENVIYQNGQVTDYRDG